MRYKFRAWDGKTMHMQDHGCVERLTTTNFEWSPFCFVFETPDGHAPKVEDWVVMQSTRLKDREGKEIFESDIVKLIGPYWRDADPDEGKVVWCEKTARFFGGEEKSS